MLEFTVFEKDDGVISEVIRNGNISSEASGLQEECLDLE